MSTRPSNEPAPIRCAREAAKLQRAKDRDQLIANVAARGIRQIEQHLKEVAER